MKIRMFNGAGAWEILTQAMRCPNGSACLRSRPLSDVSDDDWEHS
jgi:hypothetical protein